MKTIARFFAFCIPAIAFGQVTVQTNIPASLAPNSNFNVEIKINKGGISNFSKYQMDVPNGVTISEGDSKTGNFTFDANRAKIVWVSIPSDAEFVVTFKMNTGNASGSGAFSQKFFYLEDGGKKEVEFDPINVTFDASGATIAASLPASTTSASTPVATNNNNSTNSTQTSTAKTTPTVTSTPEPVKTTPTETPAVSVAKTNTPTTQAPVETNTVVSEPVKTNTVASEPVTTASTSTPEPVKTTPTETPVTTAKTTSSDMVYKVQLGAYGADPGKSRFANAGKVTVSFEGGFYKVLVGNFGSKDEAISKMNELKNSGFSGFVVAYQNGVRVK